MKIILIASVIILMSPLSFVQSSFAGQTFTNTDLEKYKRDDSGAIIPEKPPQPQKPEVRISRGSGEKSKKYWCSKGTALKTKVDRAKDKVEEAEKVLADADNPTTVKKKKISTEQRHKSAERKVRSAKKELYRAEHELAALEEDAHRQNVPPGWLRCQSGY